MKINNAEEEIRSLQLKHEFEIEVEKRAKKNLQQEKESIENELNISKQEVMALKSTVAKMTADSLGITTELQATKVVLVCLSTLNRCCSFSFAPPHGLATRPRVLALESLHTDYFIGRKGRRLFRTLKC